MKNKLYGAILGDLAGQPYEFKYKGNFSEFNLHDERSHITDDTLMTLATAEALMRGISFETAYKAIGNKYPGDYYGKRFNKWLSSPMGTVSNSWGNGCLMRISPIMYMDDYKTIRELVIQSCITSHCHPKSIIACIDLCDIYLKKAWRGSGDIEPFKEFQVEADKTMDFIKKAYWSGPPSTHEAIERVVKCGGDTDTNASIIGELNNYLLNDLSKEDIEYVESKLDSFLLRILREFN